MNERVLRRGRVIDANGQGVGGALVSVVWGTAPTPDIGRRTDDAGLFQVALPPGRFRVRAITRQGLDGEVEVEGGTDEEIVIQLSSR